MSDRVTFGGSGLDRAGNLRKNADRIEELFASPEARVLALWRGKPCFADDSRTSLAWLASGHPGTTGSEAPVFLGFDEGRPVFTLALPDWEEACAQLPGSGFSDLTEQVHPAIPESHLFADLRRSMTALTPREAELAAMGRSLLSWHAAHRFCANCGQPTRPSHGGWQRDCNACGAHHFPRTDPVVIMLVTRGNSVLIGRSAGFAERMYSLLAGYIEPGETPEDAVRREVFEESGIRVGRVSYLTSQPWPFPSSLMLAFHAEAESSEINIDPVELQDARWVTREEMARIYAGEHPEIAAGRPGAIARFIIENWLADRLPEITA
jgi:NAD+ diphosphatase